MGDNPEVNKAGEIGSRFSIKKIVSVLLSKEPSVPSSSPQKDERSTLKNALPIPKGWFDDYK
ncbi:MAG: hypothetical protein Q7R49_00510 [Candidatus Daviesbacteria bacterium]|nr:hypothetical protein [Candidatus Daviesbacteria bacterium]